MSACWVGSVGRIGWLVGRVVWVLVISGFLVGLLWRVVRIAESIERDDCRAALDIPAMWSLLDWSYIMRHCGSFIGGAPTRSQ